jgi:hypothetical protein
MRSPLQPPGSARRPVRGFPILRAARLDDLRPGSQATQRRDHQAENRAAVQARCSRFARMVDVMGFQPEHAAGVAALCRALGWPTYSDADVAARGCSAPGVATVVAIDGGVLVGFAQVLYGRRSGGLPVASWRHRHPPPTRYRTETGDRAVPCHRCLAHGPGHRRSRRLLPVLPAPGMERLPSLPPGQLRGERSSGIRRGQRSSTYRLSVVGVPSARVSVVDGKSRTYLKPDFCATRTDAEFSGSARMAARAPM